jgi:tripartite-type tricarboxylate transporter receptor subunit TctC
LPPGTPKDRVEILEQAMQRTFKDPEFPKYFKKLVDDDPSPLGAAELARLIREMPRDVEVLELIKKFSGAGPLPPR